MADEMTPRPRPRRRTKKEQFMRRYMPTFVLFGVLILIIGLICLAVWGLIQVTGDDRQTAGTPDSAESTPGPEESDKTEEKPNPFPFPIPETDSADREPPETDPPETDPPETDPPETEPPVTEPPVTYDPSYDFAVHAVDESWYDDVLFIGDSRTEGLRLYARSGNAEYFSSVGMSVFNFSSRECSDNNFPKQTLSSLLASKQYGKVFISLGINECGYSVDSFTDAYSDIIEMVRQYQPDAVIIVQGIMAVSRNYATYGSYFSPSNINNFNDHLEGLTDGETIFYIDVNEFFTDGDGYLLSYVSDDGCHLSANYTQVWANWIGYAVKELGL